MKESFLHLVWQQKLFTTKELRTVHQKNIEINHYGMVNTLQGPDISSAIVTIGEQKWAGNIEIHVNSSDWYAHQHQKDKNYQNVILHVVYHHDVEVYDVHGNEIPVLELKQYISKQIIANYEGLLQHKNTWILCEGSFKELADEKFKFWLERLMVERLERKTKEVETIWKACKGDWEATLFLMMTKYFGGTINGTIFYETFSNVDYSVIRNQWVNKTASSFLYGLLGLLTEDREDVYYQNLQKEYQYQQQKYQLKNENKESLNFYGCRPSNFPTIRLAQLIAFYEAHPAVFSELIVLGTSLKNYQNLFDVSVNDYWYTHYNFGKVSKKSYKKISKHFREILIVNVVIPVLFLYHQQKGWDTSGFLEVLYELPSEKNSILTKFKEIGYTATSALEAQALLTLKKQYCDKERCAECEVGLRLIQQNDEKSTK